MATRYHDHVSKRLFDIIVSIVSALILTPFMLCALILIKMEQVLRGRPFDPLFYSETRYSRGQPFTLYKFNIFKYEQVLALREAGVLVHTKELEHHGGILKVGWLLKQIYMDELPQLFNVLRGDMSIVGPRPVNREVYDELVEHGIRDKDRVPAGITGYYQSFKNTDNANATACDRAYADYFETHSGWRVVLFDLSIIARTLRVIARARGV